MWIVWFHWSWTVLVTSITYDFSSASFYYFTCTHYIVYVILYSNIFTAKILRIILNGKTLSIFRINLIIPGCNTETIAMVSDFLWPAVKSSLISWRGEKEKHIVRPTTVEAVWTRTGEVFYKLTRTRLENIVQC